MHASRTSPQKQKCTLTDLYNARPEWRAIAHRKLDNAVLDPCGWQYDFNSEEILEKLLALNLARAKL